MKNAMNGDSGTTETSGIQKMSAKVDSMATQLREKLADGPLGAVAGTVADNIHRAGDYIQRSDLRQVGTDMNGVFRRYPFQSALAGLGLGIVLGRTILAAKRRVSSERDEV